MAKRKRLACEDVAKASRKRACPGTTTVCQTPQRQSARLQEKQRTKNNLAKVDEEHRQLPSPSESDSNNRSSPKKRKYGANERLCQDEEQHSHVSRERRITKQVFEKPDADSSNPIDHWVDTGYWPEKMSRRGSEMMGPPSSKRGRSESNHRCSTVQRMAAHGVSMESSNSFEKASEELCDQYMKGDKKTIKSSVFAPKEFAQVLDRVRNLNEARIQRDITPWVVPAAEVLYIRGDLDHSWIGEELNTEWIRCAPMGSTRPKPDYVAGLQRTAFSEEELKKLDNYATPERPFQFTPELTYPFLICEAKTGEVGLNAADRQNIHSASIAVRAIFALYQEAFGRTMPHRIRQLDGHVLVFTVSHDHDRACIYAQFAVADSESPEVLKYYRHPLALYSLTMKRGAERHKAYNIVRRVYERFAPEHRQRIRDAVAHLPTPPERTGLSLTGSEFGLDQLDPGTSQGDDTRPDEPSSTRIREQMEQQRNDSKQHIDKLLQQLEQQRLDNNEQMERVRQDNNEQMERLRQDSNAQLDRQRRQMEDQLQQQKEIISLLKGSNGPIRMMR